MLQKTRFYNCHASYNVIAESTLTQEFVRILRYIPDNILVCADNIIPYEVWRTLQDYFDGKAPDKLIIADNDICCRKLFSEVEYSDIQKHSLDKYVIQREGRFYNSPLEIYDLHNSNAKISIDKTDIALFFNDVYNKNDNFWIIKNHKYIPSLQINFHNTRKFRCTYSSIDCTISNNKPYEIDQQNIGDILSNISCLETYRAVFYNDTVQCEFFIESKYRLRISFDHGGYDVKEYSI